MSASQPDLDRLTFRLLLGAVCTVALGIVLIGPWYVPSLRDTGFWNALIAFTILGIASDSSFLPNPRISTARVGSSVVFIPFLAAAMLFEHPWPMVIALVTGLVSQVIVRRKSLIRAAFNTAQYMLGVGLGGLVYRALGGHVGFDAVELHLQAFVALVVVFFVVNHGTVSLAVSFTTDTSPREAWRGIAGGLLPYDLISSSLAIVLAYLFVKFQVIGLTVLVLPLFFVRHVYRMNLQLERANRELLELMVKAIEARDPYTSGHSIRVSEYARSMARELGLSAKHVEDIATAALLHDVGKIHEDFAPLLRKAGRLTPEERMLMQAHPVRSADLAGIIAEFRGRVQTDIRNHHENYDGTGYPDGLKGEGIPIGARIIMIADTIDAMTTDRPYRKALTLAKALEEMVRYAGRQFDPKLVTLVSNSPSIRRLLGPQLVTEPQQIPSMQLPTRAARGVRASST
ncbi:MAG TPA: HD-GYP domain-containing protein [Candidatus Polarisedimenticolia bacterium]|nr:HD-GYP domain-containing protein [Candidatus Polarisedimenticolia bacterium]